MEGGNKSMSKQIDQNVVALEFDNRNFEKNVKQSMNTLDQLEKKCDMKGSTKGLDALGKAANKVSFDNMSRSIDTVRIKLSAMQVVGMTVLSNITNQAFNFAKKVESTVKDAVIGGGIRRAQNIENAHFMLQGLLKDEKKVQEVMDNAMESVDGTAYAYDEAAKAASQFAASGIEAGDQMKQALRGITGVAAMTNASYENISRVFTTVAGNGRLMGDQLLQLSSRGMNAAATLATHFGKTEEEIRDMVSHGEISFAMFAEAMDDAFGEHAKKANETFNGALSNIKAALSRFGAKFVSPLVVQNGVIVKLFNTIRERVNDISADLDPLASIFVAAVERVTKKLNTTLNNKKAFRNTLDGIENIIMAMGNFAKIVHDAFREIFPAKSQADITKATKAFADLTERLLLTDKSAEKLKNTFKGVFAILDIIAYLGKSVISTIAYIFKDITVETTNTDVAVTDMIMAFRDWIKEGDKVGSVMRKIVDVVKSAVNTITKFNKTVKGGGGGGMQSNMTAFQKFASVVATVFNGVNNYIAGGIEAIKAFAERTKDLEGMTVGDVFKDFAENVIGYFFDIGAAFDWLMGVISKFSSNTKSEFDKTQNVFTSFGKGILSKLKEFKDKYFKEADFSSVYAVLFSAGTIMVLRKIGKSIEKFASFTDKLLGPITGITKVLKSFSGVLLMYQKKLKADVILEFAAAIAVLAGSVAILALVPADRLWPAVGAITALVAGLSIVTAILANANFNASIGTLAEVGVAMVGFAAAMLILAKTIDAIGEIDNFYDKFVRLLKIAVLMTTSIAVLTLAVGAISALSHATMSLNLVGVGVAMVGFAAALRLIVSALGSLEKLDMNKISADKIKALAKTLAAFSLVVFASRGVSLKASLGVVAMAASLKIVVSALKDLETLNFEALSDNIGSIITVFGAMGAMAIMGSFAGKNVMKAGIGILAMAVGLKLILSTFKKIDQMKPKSIAKSILTLAGVFGAFSILIVASSKAGKEAHKAGLMLLEVSAAMILITGAVAILGNMKTEKLKQGVAAIAVLETFFGGLIALSKLGTASKEGLSQIVALGIMTFALAGLVAGLTLLDQDKLQNATACLSILMGVFGGLYALIAYVSKFSGKDLQNIALNMTLVILAMGAIGLIISELAKLPADQVKTAANALSEVSIVFGGLTALCVYLGKLGPEVVEAAAVGGAAFDTVVTLVAMLVAGLGGIAISLEELTGYDIIENFEKGIEIFGKLGETIGAFVGGIGAGMMNEMSGTLPTLGSNLADFMTNAQPFFDGLNSITPEMTESAKNLTLAIGVLMAESFLTKLGKFAEFMMGPFGKMLNSGETSNFAEGAKMLGQGVSAFAEATKDITPETAKNLESTSKAAESLTKLADTIPNTGGKLGEWLGNNDMDVFGKALASFGKSLVKYATTVDGLNTEAIETSVPAAESLINIADMIPNSGISALSLLVGDNTMDSFGTALESFGESLVEYSNTVVGIKYGALELSKTAAETVIEIANMIPANSGVIQAFTGDMKLSKFADNLTTFAYGLVDFSTKMTECNFGVIQSCATPIKALLDAFEVIPKKKDFKHLDKFGDQIIKFAENLSKFSKKTKKIEPTSITAMAKAINSLNDVFSNLGNFDSEAGEKFNKALKSISTRSLTNFAKSFSESSKDLSKCGTDMIDNVIKGINSNKDGIKVNLMNNVISAIAGVRSTYSSWFSAGSYLVQGLSNGILSQTANAIAAARKIGSSANDALKNELREESPSKESYEYGEFYVTGFVNALGAGEKKVGKVAASLGKITNKMLKNSIMSTDTLTNMRRWLGDAAGALDQFVNRYINGASNMSVANGAMQSAAQAIRDYMNVLYKRSSYYATDTKNLKDHKSQLKDLEKQNKSLQKQIKSATKENTKKSKERVKTLKSELKTNKEAIKQAKNQIEQDQQDIVEHTKQAYNDLKNSLKQSVESFINPLAVSIESGINLFSKFENKETQLAEAQKNLTDYTNEYETALQKQKDLQNEIEKMEKINTTASRQHGKELEKELEAVTKTVDKLKDKVQDYQDQVTELSTFTTRSVLDDMKSQAENVEKYWANINKLYSEGKFSTGLLDQLKTMGIEGSDYVNKFVEMTQTEIDEANSYFERAGKTSATALLRNFEDAMNQATSWSDGIAKLEAKGFNRAILEGLGDLGINGADYLEAFLSMDESQIAAFNEKYARYLKLPDEVADSVISSYAIAGNQTVDAFIEALNGVTEKLQEVIGGAGEEIKTQWGLKAGPIALDVCTKLKDSLTSDKNTKKAKKAGKTLGKSTMKGFTDKDEGVNKNTAEKSVNDFTKGVTSGVKNNESKTSKKFKEWAETLVQSFRGGLDEHSPSKEAIKAIKYFADGIVIGFDNSVGEVSTAAENVANVILDSVSNVLDSDLDTQPTITPVIDLSEIQNGANSINQTLGNMSGTISLDNSKANSIQSIRNDTDSVWGAINELKDTVKQLGNVQGETVINNQFNIENPDPNAVANEVSIILQRQIDRRSKEWA